jgi:hypothetical protein
LAATLIGGYPIFKEAFCDPYQMQSAIALRGKSVQKELMASRSKAARQFRLERRKTSLQFVKPLALVALEVMMMSLAGHFIASGITGNLDGLQPSLGHQRLDISLTRRPLNLCHLSC